MPNSEDSPIYNSRHQLAIGLAGEAVLDRYFSDKYEIKNAQAHEQKLGIDRYFRCRITGRMVSVEFKTDYQAHKTGNAFVETVSFSQQNQTKKGWAYTCQADWLIYFCYHLEKAYVIEPEYLRSVLVFWKTVYQERRVLNDGWITSGIAVPLGKIRLAALRVLRIEVY